MKKLIYISILFLLGGSFSSAQTIDMDPDNWDVKAPAHLFETYQGKKAIYLQGGTITAKDVEFLDGTIEFDLFLKPEQCFPGVFFRLQEETGDAEEFYVRPHLPGKPDATQAIALIQNLSAWQLYFGTRYSFPYDFQYDDWTHIKIAVKGDKAQVFMDYSKEPQLSWNLFHKTRKGKISLRGGNRTGMYISGVKISHESPELIDFSPNDRVPLEGLISEWTVSDMFAEDLLKDPTNLKSLIKKRSWGDQIKVEEGTAANISRARNIDAGEGNTAFAKVIIDSDKAQLKNFEFGYSDRVVVILNGKPIYTGTNRYRSRDYRYLGTIGLFDSVYLDLKKGENELLLAVSEDFGGWLVTGRITNMGGIRIQTQ